MVRPGLGRRIAHRGSLIGVSQRVNRGGSWNNKPANVRSAQRARSVVRTVRLIGNYKSLLTVETVAGASAQPHDHPVDHTVGLDELGGADANYSWQQFASSNRPDVNG